LHQAALEAANVLRVDPSDLKQVKQAEVTIESGAILVEMLSKYAKVLGTTRSKIWQNLLGVCNNSNAGNIVTIRTPPPRSKILKSSKHQGRDIQLGGEKMIRIRQHLGPTAVQLHKLLRLSLCDDADLDLAAKVISETAGFFGRMRAKTTEKGIEIHTLWVNLLQ